MIISISLPKLNNKFMELSSNSFLYKLFIDPVLSKVHNSVVKEIKSSDRVIDVACGTGSMTLAISGKAKSVMGIDISEAMISSARRTTNRKHICNAAFMVLDAADMEIFRPNEYEVAVISMAVHQFDAEQAVKILSEMKRIAAKIIILDYNYPQPAGFFRKLVCCIERIAGEHHYSNFKEYIDKGGIQYFTEKAGLSIKSKLIRSNGIFTICTCERKD